MARIVGGVVGDFDMRKPDPPDDEYTEEGGKHGRGERVGPRDSVRPGSRSGIDDVRLHGSERWLVAMPAVVPDRDCLAPGLPRRAACLFDRKRIRKNGVGRELCHDR